MKTYFDKNIGRMTGTYNHDNKNGDWETKGTYEHSDKPAKMKNTLNTYKQHVKSIREQPQKLSGFEYKIRKLMWNSTKEERVEMKCLINSELEQTKNKWFEIGYKQGKISKYFHKKIKENPKFLDDSLKNVVNCLSK